MITDNFSKQAQSGRTLYCLLFTFEEPVPGLHRLYAELTPEERVKVENVIYWFNDHGGDGEYLARWLMFNAGEQPTQVFDYPGIIQEIRLQSRYDEGDLPGEFYGGPNPYLMDN